MRGKRLDEAENERLKLEDPELKKSNQSKATTNEFNLLAELICQPSEDNFKLNLFPEQFGFSAKQKDPKQKQDDNMISIDLGKQRKDVRLDSVIKDVESFSLKGADQKTTGDDLLDMMDNL